MIRIGRTARVEPARGAAGMASHYGGRYRPLCQISIADPEHQDHFAKLNILRRFIFLIGVESRGGLELFYVLWWGSMAAPGKAPDLG
jgi:hypothetical protein